MKDFLKLIFFGISKGPGVEIYNPDTDDISTLRVGFNFSFFLLSGFFGIPLFLKGLWKWGLFMFAISAYDQYLDIQKMSQFAGAMTYKDLFAVNLENPAENILMVTMVACSFLLGFKGNEWVARKRLAEGWRFVNPDHEMVKKAAKKWHLSKHYLKPVKKTAEKEKL